MPPVVFVASAGAASSASGGRSIAVANTPALAQPGDTLLFVIAASDPTTGLVDTALLPSGWEVATALTGGASAFTICRRIVTAAEPATHTITCAGSPAMVAALLCYRGLDTSSAVAGSLTSITTATAFVCPTRTTAAYSDMYIGVVFAITAPTFLPPAGTNTRLNATLVYNGSQSMKLVIFDLVTEQVGLTGTKTATASSSTTGFASSVLVVSTPPPTLQAIVADVPGAIGFVDIGV